MTLFHIKAEFSSVILTPPSILLRSVCVVPYFILCNFFFAHFDYDYKGIKKYPKQMQSIEKFSITSTQSEQQNETNSNDYVKMMAKSGTVRW